MSAVKVNHKDLQALFRGFDRRWPQGRFYYCRYESPEAGKALLTKVGTPTSYLDLDDYPPIAKNAALTYRGLQKLELNPDVLEGFPGDFRQGMLARARMNLDVDENDPKNWDEVWQKEKGVHLWIGIYAKSPKALEDWHNDFTAWISAPASGRSVSKGNGEDADIDVTLLGTQDVKRFWSDDTTRMHIDDESSNPAKPVVLEHFGFRDGVSQPNIEGHRKNIRVRSRC